MSCPVHAITAAADANRLSRRDHQAWRRATSSLRCCTVRRCDRWAIADPQTSSRPVGQRGRAATKSRISPHANARPTTRMSPEGRWADCIILDVDPAESPEEVARAFAAEGSCAPGIRLIPGLSGKGMQGSLCTHSSSTQLSRGRSGHGYGTASIQAGAKAMPTTAVTHSTHEIVYVGGLVWQLSGGRGRCGRHQMRRPQHHVRVLPGSQHDERKRVQI